MGLWQNGWAFNVLYALSSSVQRCRMKSIRLWKQRNPGMCIRRVWKIFTNWKEVSCLSQTKWGCLRGIADFSAAFVLVSFFHFILNKTYSRHLFQEEILLTHTFIICKLSSEIIYAFEKLQYDLPVVPVVVDQDQTESILQNPCYSMKVAIWQVSDVELACIQKSWLQAAYDWDDWTERKVPVVFCIGK